MIESLDDSLVNKKTNTIGAVFLLAVAMLLPFSTCFAAKETNRMVSLQMASDSGSPVLEIVTEKPIGYRYTVYDSEKNLPTIVISFPLMEKATVASITDVNQPPVQRVDVSSDVQSWGRLTQVEVVLSHAADYDITVIDNKLMLTLPKRTGQERAMAVEPVTAVNQSAVLPVSAAVDTPESILTAIPEDANELRPLASKIVAVDVEERVVSLKADGVIENYKFFSLVAPERLVVDVYGVKLGFDALSYKLGGAFSRMRVGIYEEKLRFVFDASADVPDHAVVNKGESIVVNWGPGASKAAGQLQ